MLLLRKKNGKLKMPIIKTIKGYKYGKHGHVYKKRAGALRQMRAIKASQSRRKK